jgi:hypothetical protein
MSLLNTKVLPTLTGMREARIKSFKEETNDKGGYVRVVLQLSDREYQYCIFPKQVEYVTSALRSQLELQDKEVTLADVLEAAKETDIKVWFAYNTDFNRMNVAFHEPRVVESEEGVEL